MERDETSKLWKPNKWAKLSRRRHSNTTNSRAQTIEHWYLNQDLNLVTYLLLLKFLITNMISFFKMILIPMEILSGTFSEYQTLIQAKESDSTCWISPSLIPCITMVWRFYAFQTKWKQRKESAGTELARTLIIIKIYISERTIGSTNDYIIHSLLPGHFSMLMTNSFSLIVSHIPTLICRKIWVESKETPIHQIIIIEEHLRGHWREISANTYQSPRKTKTPRA